MLITDTTYSNFVPCCNECGAEIKHVINIQGKVSLIEHENLGAWFCAKCESKKHGVCWRASAATCGIKC